MTEGRPDGAPQFKGTPPPQFLQALKEIRGQKEEMLEEQKRKDPFSDVAPTEVQAQAPVQPKPELRVTQPPQQKFAQQKKPSMLNTPPSISNVSKIRPVGSAQLEELLNDLRGKGVQYDEITLPSRGIFYDGKDGPVDGVLHLRPMTGEEEQILATPRHFKRGNAVNMIFNRCIKENYKSDEFLSVDRTYILVWLRGISYGHEYEVEIKCPDCDKKFAHSIDLGALMTKYCPDNFGPLLQDTLPVCGYTFTWHLPRGKDETVVQNYKDRMLKEYGDGATDDSMMFRMSLMLDEVQGLKDKTELMVLLKKLPVKDISYLRTLAVDPPFGVDTKCPITCPSCYHDFEVELPLESGFFFPRHKRKVEETTSDSGDI